MRNKNFTAQESDIWNATYAAAFVSSYMSRYERSSSHDIAQKYTTADDAGFIADYAVRRLREWRESEDPDMGIELMELSE